MLLGELGECVPAAQGVERSLEDQELAAYSTEPRALVFNSALMAPKATRSTQGVQVLTMKPKFKLESVRRLEDTGITNLGRYRGRSIPATGALVKEEDSDDKQMQIL